MQRVIAFGSAIVLLTACGDGDGRDTDTQGQITSASQGLTTLTTTSETGDDTETETGEETEAGTDGSSGDASTDATDATGDPTTGDPTDEPTTDDPTTGDPTDDPTTGNPTTGDPTDSDSDTGEECAAISESAELKPLPADIIFALDTSGSMDIEISSVKNNMNAFSSTIINRCPRGRDRRPGRGLYRRAARLRDVPGRLQRAGVSTCQ